MTSWRLSALVAGLGTIDPARDPLITAVTDDSRRARPGALFVAIRGTHGDGRSYVPEAVSRGAAAIVADAGVGGLGDVPLVRVPSARLALAAIAARFHGHPARALQVIGFTGTFGKTATSAVLSALLEEAGHPTAVIGSLGAAFRGHHVPSGGLTTPAPAELHALFRDLADRGACTVVMEVTSHALLLERVAGVVLGHGIMGAIVPGEHTDFHRTYGEYVAAKGRLLPHVDSGGVLAYDRDNAAARRFADAWDPPRRAGLAVGARAEEGPLDVTLRRPGIDADGAVFTIRGRDLRSALLGRHNVRNVGMAITMASAIGVELDAIARVLPELRALRRRMELFDVAGRRVLDDTAGHPESLSAAFEVAALVPHARLHVAYVLRGSRGALVNAQNATALADLALLHDAASITVSAAADGARPEDRASEAEIDAARRSLSTRGVEFSWDDTLEGAIQTVAAASRADDLVLLLGAQGMDKGAALLRAALGA